MINFVSDQKTITEIAKKVLLEMGQKGVALTPENYQVWFEYCTGSNESLTAHISEIVTSGKTFTAEINKDLYDMFFGKGKEERIVTKIPSYCQVLCLRFRQHSLPYHQQTLSLP